MADNDTITLFFHHFNMGFHPSGQGQECLDWGEGAVLSVYDGDSVDNETLRTM